MALPVSQVECLEICERPFIGKHIFDILTSGMYNDPMMIFREYIQNAVDSIDLAEKNGIYGEEAPEIHISVFPMMRTISIYDNGAGINNASVRRRLSNIAMSDKDPLSQRGFRGIGRLSGLAYSKYLLFETRSAQNEQVAVFKWDRDLLNNYLKNRGEFKLEDLIRRCTQLSFREANDDESDHFFRVTLEQVSRFHDDKLFSLLEIKNHIACTCPVPYEDCFEPFKSQIKDYLSGFAGFNEYVITVNGEKIYKPFEQKKRISEKIGVKIESIQCFSIPGVSGKPIAKGWFAITNFQGSLPKSVLMRGIRFRQGNLAVGNEYCCAEFYPESRFACWNLGEIHCSPSLVPNARRDGFEFNKECEKLFEALIELGKYLTRLIRNHSKLRCTLGNFEREVAGLEKEFSLLPFLGERSVKMFKEKVERLKEMIQVNEKKFCKNILFNELSNILQAFSLNDKSELFLNEEHRKSEMILAQYPVQTQQVLKSICEELNNNHGSEVVLSVINVIEKG